MNSQWLLRSTPFCSRRFPLLFALISLLYPTPSAAEDKDNVYEAIERDQGEARRLYQQGEKLLQAGKHEKALELFKRSFLLDRTWECASYLGYTEFLLKRYRDAAEHLEYFLNHADREVVDEETRKEFRDYFKEATSKVASLTITVNQPDAEVMIDDKSLGRSPILNVIYVDPSTHIIHASKDGFQPTQAEINPPIGTHKEVKLSLQPISPVVPRNPPPPRLLAAHPPSNPSPPFLVPAWLPAITATAGGIGLGIGISAVTIGSDQRNTTEFTIAGFAIGGTILASTIVLLAVTTP